MKKKLLCVFFMLAGGAVFAGTILISSERSEYHDQSPVYMLIFLSVITIAIAALLFSKELSKLAVSKPVMVFIWVFRIVNLVSILSGFAYLAIMLFSISTFFTIILIFAIIPILAITVTAWRSEEEPDEFEVTRRGMALLWVFRALSILNILAGFAFIVIMWFLTGRYVDLVLYNVLPLMILAAAGIAAAMLSLKLRAPLSGQGLTRAARCIPIAVALAVRFALGFVYLNYMPEYSLNDGLSALRSNQEFAQKDIFYPFRYSLGGPDGRAPRWADPLFDEMFGVNPYYNELFEYSCDSYRYDADGLHIVKGYIIFNPATGAYEYMRTQEQDKTYSPGEWPEFNYNLMYDKDQHHNPVINLYYRGWRLPDAASEMNVIFIADSGEWDAKMKDIMYPHNLPEDEARAFLLSMGEEALKTKLLERFKGGKDIEVFFYGINIATYQNGEIVLKL